MKFNEVKSIIIAKTFANKTVTREIFIVNLHVIFKLFRSILA